MEYARHGLSAVRRRVPGPCWPLWQRRAASAVGVVDGGSRHGRHRRTRHGASCSDVRAQPADGSAPHAKARSRGAPASRDAQQPKVRHRHGAKHGHGFKLNRFRSHAAALVAKFEDSEWPVREAAGVVEKREPSDLRRPDLSPAGLYTRGRPRVRSRASARGARRRASSSAHCASRSRSIAHLRSARIMPRIA